MGPVPELRQNGIPQLREAAQLRPESGHARLDVRRVRAVDPGAKRKDIGCLGIGGVAERGKVALCAAVGQAERVVPLVLQVLCQEHVLLAKLGQVQHAAELRRAALGGGHLEAAEDQAHDEREADHGVQPA